VKRSGRDESVWVVIHKCMEAMPGISPYSYLYPKLAKTICLSYYLLCFLFNIIREEGRAGSAWKGSVGGDGGVSEEVAHTVFTHVSKCKNDKRRKKKK
jgi:hypothetical protein